MPHLTLIQTARAIAKLEENWSLAAVARELDRLQEDSHLQYKEALARKQASDANTNTCWKGFFTKVYFHFNNV
jgi:hypothetical protein